MIGDLFKLQQQTQQQSDKLELEGLQQPTSQEVRSTNAANTLSGLITDKPTNLFDAIAGGVTEGLAATQRGVAANEQSERAQKLQEAVERQREEAQKTKQMLDLQIDVTRTAKMVDASISTAVASGQSPADALNSNISHLKETAYGKLATEGMGIGEIMSFKDMGDNLVVAIGTEGARPVNVLSLISDPETRATIAQSSKPDGNFQLKMYTLPDGSEIQGVFDKKTGRAQTLSGEPISGVIGARDIDEKVEKDPRVVVEEYVVDIRDITEERAAQRDFNPFKAALAGDITTGAALTVGRPLEAIAQSLGKNAGEVRREFNRSATRAKNLLLTMDGTPRLKLLAENLNDFADFTEGVFRSQEDIVMRMWTMGRTLEDELQILKATYPRLTGSRRDKALQQIQTIVQVQHEIGVTPDVMDKLRKQRAVGSDGVQEMRNIALRAQQQRAGSTPQPQEDQPSTNPFSLGLRGLTTMGGDN